MKGPRMSSERKLDLAWVALVVLSIGSARLGSGDDDGFAKIHYHSGFPRMRWTPTSPKSCLSMSTARLSPTT